MSADNGIYIASFPDGFHVIHAQAIENLEYFPEGSVDWKLEINSYFRTAPLFLTKEEAWAFAAKKSELYTILEYGVSYIGHFDHVPQESTGV